MLKEHLERLRQTQQVLALRHTIGRRRFAKSVQVVQYVWIWLREEGGDSVAAVVDYAALVCGRVVSGGRWIELGQRRLSLVVVVVMMTSAAIVIVVMIILMMMVVV